MGCSPGGCKESSMTEWLTLTYIYLITVNTQKRILLNTPLSFHLVFRKGSYYETVNIIGLKIPGNLVHGVREDTTIVKCNEVGLYVLFPFVISFQSYYFTLTDNRSSVKKKLPLTYQRNKLHLWFKKRVSLHCLKKKEKNWFLYNTIVATYKHNF